MRKSIAAPLLVLAGLGAMICPVKPVNANPPCPSGGKDPGTQYSDAMMVYTVRYNCQLAWSIEGLVQRGHHAVFSFYCPHQLDEATALKVARFLVDPGPPPPASGNYWGTTIMRIQESYNALGLKPEFVRLDHRYHYTCGSNYPTHIKIRVRAKHPVDAREIAKRASHTAVALTSDSPTSAHFRLKTHLLPGDPESFRREVATWATRRYYGESARTRNRKFCFQSVAIQCAPCTSTDSLSVRFHTYPPNQACPSGTLFEDREPLATYTSCMTSCTTTRKAQCASLPTAQERDTCNDRAEYVCADECKKRIAPLVSF
jgi:hypothetical protein